MSSYNTKNDEDDDGDIDIPPFLRSRDDFQKPCWFLFLIYILTFGVMNAMLMLYCYYYAINL